MSAIGALVFGLAALGATTLGGGCDNATNAGPKPCNEDPFQCSSAQTCWPNQASSAFACLPVGPAKSGEACELVAGAPTCGTGLICLMEGTTGAKCTPYCDPYQSDKACASGASCRIFMLGMGGVSLKACDPGTAGTGSTGAGG